MEGQYEASSCFKQGSACKNDILSCSVLCFWAVFKIFLIPLQPKELQLAKVSVDQSSNAGSEDGMSKSSEEKSSPSDSDMEAEASKGSKGKSLKKIAITTEPVREISENEDSDSEMLEKFVVPSTKSVSVRCTFNMNLIILRMVL